MSESTDVTITRKTIDRNPKRSWEAGLQTPRQNAALRQSRGKRTDRECWRMQDRAKMAAASGAVDGVSFHAWAGDACLLTASAAAGGGREGTYPLPVLWDGAASAPTHSAWASRRLQLIATLLAIGLVVWIVDWGRVVEVWRMARLDLAGLAAATFAADRLLMGYKWRLLLEAQGARLALRECWGLYSLATLTGSLMPATIGGDVVRIAWLWRRGIPSRKSLASIALERLIGAVVALSGAALALAYLSAGLAGQPELRPIFGIALTALALLVAGVLLSFWQGVLTPLAWLRGRLGGKLAASIKAAHASYVVYLSNPGVVARFVLLTVVEYLLILAATYLAALALRIEVGPLDFAAALALATLLARLPIAIDGLGVFEGSLIGLLALAGVNPAESLALAIATRLLVLLVCAPPAAHLLATAPIRLRDLARLRDP